MIEMGKRAKAAAAEIGRLNTKEKNEILKVVAENLLKNTTTILEENAKDVEEGKKSGLTQALIDRLTLDEKRIQGMIESVEQVIALPDPVGQYIDMKTLPNELKVGRKRVPFGVVAIIYESRPNVTVDTASLCIKSSNALILRGGKEAYRSNMVLTGVIRDSLKKLGYNPDIVQFVENQSRDAAEELMRLNGYVDVLIPRGGAQLIHTVVQKATVPVIETGIGNCHVYVDASADLDMAVEIAINAKTQRPGVCNAMESLLVHKDVASSLIPRLTEKMIEMNVKIVGDEKSIEMDERITLATEEDWGCEYLDLIYAQKIVADVDEAIAHINRYGSGHSEVIVTKNYDNAVKFTDEVDAAAVYVNASSRFTDGFELGLGAEMGISTQKLHVRGPVGLEALTTSKLTVFGNGQIRK